MRSPRISIPRNVHPTVKRLFAVMHEQGKDYATVEADSGVAAAAMKNWRWRHSPVVENLDACLNALGYELRVCKREDA